jgi:hypothetical protein
MNHPQREARRWILQASEAYTLNDPAPAAEDVTNIVHLAQSFLERHGILIPAD